MSSSFVIMLIVFVALTTVATVASPVDGTRAFFVFGDSLVDNGNNNYLATPARADSPPYGIDYPSHRPTGRFCNGKNLPDLISEALGAETTLAYLNPELKGNKLLIGANFASAGVGILNDTGVQFAVIIRINQQLEHFHQYQRRVTSLIGEQQTQELVNKALVLVTLGGNDFINNYFLAPITPRRLEFNIQDYCQYLISEYKKILQRLHDLGARRVLVTGTGPMGCAPAEIALRGRNGNCAEELQRASGIFNPLLVQMVSELNKELGSDVFVAVNAVDQIFDNPQAFGFEITKVACCGQGPYNGIGICTIASHICPNRDIYVFWDAFHPTEKVNRVIVQTIFNGSQKYMSPMNLSTIMELDSRT
ncbi:hypothetical protein RD792_003254 [Penstemon davidsonii]|uniref:Uncharacterized protein n=1 Tax=Penstemon davidsonii TaxID=160366 RepID=A0ABR0DUD6_9LAMI|nr:hypothetical protein RD792_003254 [Penstemon davidsonii]